MYVLCGGNERASKAELCFSEMRFNTQVEPCHEIRLTTFAGGAIVSALSTKVKDWHEIHKSPEKAAAAVKQNLPWSLWSWK